MRRLSSGSKSPTLTSLLITRSSWRRIPMPTFISSTHDLCGDCGRFCKTIQTLRSLVIHRRPDSSELQCCYQFVLILMLSSTFHQRDWMENVITIATRWVAMATKQRLKLISLSTDQRSLHIWRLASTRRREALRHSSEFSWRPHRLPTRHHKNSSEQEILLIASLHIFVVNSYRD